MAMISLLCALSSMSTPYGYTNGVRFIRYGNEGFSSIKEDTILSYLDKTGCDYEYNSIQVEMAYCPSVAGSYSFRAEGNPRSQIQYGSDSKNPSSIGTEGWCSSNKEDYETSTYTLSTSYCYPVQAFFRTGCNLISQVFKLQVSYNGGSYADTSSSQTIANWSLLCQGLHYGSDCSSVCDVYCNGNGRCSEGYSGTGKCICTSFTDNPFCENTSSSLISSSNLGLTESIYDTETAANVVSTSVLTTANLTTINLCYQMISLSGYLYVPQNGYYEFKANGTTNSVLSVNGNSTSTSVLAQNGCSYSTDIETDVIKETLTIGLIPINLQYLSGCPMYDQTVSIYWRFFRYYDYSSSTPWEAIPSRYLSTKSSLT